MTTVIDAGFVVAVTVGGGPHDEWATALVGHDDFVAPHLVLVEVTSALRRRVRTGRVSAEVATLAVHDALALDVELFPYEPFAERVWELRNNMTSYDAWYVAVAEALDAPLATLDTRLAQAPGPRCRFTTPPD